MFNGRTFVLGDVHGCHDALLECLDAVNFDFKNDRLISLGDLVDRGPSSFKVAETMIKIKNKILVQGNHDIWFKDLLLFQQASPSHPQFYLWSAQGGHETINSYIVEGGLNLSTGDFRRKKEHMALYGAQVPFHYENGMCFVHGGFDRRLPIGAQDPVSLAWDRAFVDEMMSCTGTQKLRTADNFVYTFIGHTPTIYWRSDKPIFRGGVWNLDTGCGKGGKLTIFNLATHEYYQTKDGHK